MARWGVSPAWMISRYGETFGPAEIRAELPKIAAAGFDTVQLETFLVEKIELWERGGCEELLLGLEEAALEAEVFVAHCLLHGFSGSEALVDSAWAKTALRIARIVESLPGIKVVSVPFPAFEGVITKELFMQLEEQWRRVSEPFRQRGLNPVVEIMPGSAGSSAEGLSRLMDSPVFDGTGLNFDSGHFNTAGIDPADVLKRYGRRIMATHLCDNDGVENSSSLPGSGTVRWSEVTAGLLEAGYSGSWDIELICEPGLIESTYRQALNFLHPLVSGAEQGQ